MLSKSVKDAFAYYNDPATEETQKFISMVDRFFDCLNVRCRNEWAMRKKPDLKPYTSVDDDRFSVSHLFISLLLSVDLYLFIAVVERCVFEVS